jgi:hypothetical protein
MSANTMPQVGPITHRTRPPAGPVRGKAVGDAEVDVSLHEISIERDEADSVLHGFTRLYPWNPACSFKPRGLAILRCYF